VITQPQYQYTIKYLEISYIVWFGSGFDKKYLKSDVLFYAKNQTHLLVGVFRGDGCTIDNGMALSLSNKDLIKQLYNIALREGLTPKIRVPKASSLATKQSHYYFRKFTKLPY